MEDWCGSILGPENGEWRMENENLESEITRLTAEKSSSSHVFFPLVILGKTTPVLVHPKP